jgi:hypothetical protein
LLASETVSALQLADMLSEALEKRKNMFSEWGLSNFPERTKYHTYLQNTHYKKYRMDFTEIHWFNDCR